MEKRKINPLSVDKRMNHQFIPLGTFGKGWGNIRLSSETVAGYANGGIKFIKNGNELTLTKEELINEFKIGLEKGYFKKEDLLI